MAEITRNIRINPWLPTSVLATFTLSFVFIVIMLTEPAEPSKALATTATLVGMFFIALTYLLSAELRRKWSLEGYPPAVDVCRIIFQYSILYVRWWTLELRSWNPEKHILAWAALAYALSVVVFVPLSCVAAYPTLGGWTWAVLAAGEMFFLWLYTSTTFDYLDVAD